jgi:hypothetical protein
VSLRRKGQAMSSRFSSGFVIAGCIFMFLGLCFLPAALNNHNDASLLEMGACVFSLGALITAFGTYLKAKFLSLGAAPAEPAETGTRRTRGGCDLCGTEAPVVLCKSHQVHLCGECLTQHYDQRSCNYIPTTRTTGQSRNGKSLSAKASS